MRILALAALAAFSAVPLQAQRVETLAAGPPLNGPDGAAVDAAGRLYVANWGAGKGTTVVRMDAFAGGSAPAVFLDGFQAPDALLFDGEGNLFVSNFAAGTVERITPAGARTVVASGLGHPSALAMDGDGSLYVSDFGSYDGTTVHRIAPDGTVAPFATGFSAPLGLAFGPGGDLFVASFNTGTVHRVRPDGTAAVFARVENTPPARLQYLVFDECGTLYVPSYGHNVVYAIDPAGRARVLAGARQAGGADGEGAEARFDGPNSIVRLPDGDLVVTEYNASRVRRIHMPPCGAGGP